jgi:hypothetical protein
MIILLIRTIGDLQFLRQPQPAWGRPRSAPGLVILLILSGCVGRTEAQQPKHTAARPSDSPGGQAVRLSDEPESAVPGRKHKARQTALDARIAAAEKALSQYDANALREFPVWQRRMKVLLNLVQWFPVRLVEARSEQGATITKLEDGSLLVEGMIPDRDVLTVVAETSPGSIGGIRLETLTHRTLPNSGPGLSPDGNFVLNEFEVRAAPLSADGTPGKPQSIRLKEAIADHSQDGHPIASAIDGNRKTGWAIDVNADSSNVDRAAVFLPAEPVAGGDRGMRLTIMLRQNHSVATHLIGRLRLMVTGTPPEALSLSSAEDRRILRLAPEERTGDQQERLLAVFRRWDRSREPLQKRVEKLKRKRGN